MSFARFVARRVASAVLLVVVVSGAALLLTRCAPDDRSLETNRAVVAAERRAAGLDDPFLQQYGRWLIRSMRLDFGRSLLYGVPVTQLLKARAANTALLGLTALLLATAIGIPLGVFTGSHHHGIGAALARATSLVLLSVPPLVTSLTFLMIAARTGWLPAGGLGAIPPGASLFEAGLITAKHLILPSLALALPIAASLERLQSRSMSEALAEPCMMAAVARGIPRHQLIWRHGLRLSLKPVLAIYGITIGSVLSGSFAVEIVMTWPGLGNLMWEALKARDLYLVAGCATAGAVFLSLGILVSELALAAIDPRLEELS